MNKNKKPENIKEIAISVKKLISHNIYTVKLCENTRKIKGFIKSVLTHLISVNKKAVLAVTLGVFLSSSVYADERAYLNYVIDDASARKIHRIIRKIDQLRPGENLYLHINSRGGDIDIGNPVIDAIHRSPGRVIGILDGIAASMAAEILINCDHIIVDPTEPDDMVYIHDAHAVITTFPGGTKIVPISDYHHQVVKDWKGILTKEELKAIGTLDKNRCKRAVIFSAKGFLKRMLQKGFGHKISTQDL